MKKLITSNYDLAGNGFFRVMTLGALNKILPVGNFRHGLGLRPAFTLLFLHWFGRPVFWISIRFEKQLRGIYLRLRPNREN